MSTDEITQLRSEIQQLRAEATQVVREHGNAINSLLDRCDALEARLGGADWEKQVSVWREALQRVHNYTTLILGLGYGGILAIWSQSDEVRVLYPAEFIASGGLVLLSLLLFLSSEVYASWLIMKATGGKQISEETMRAQEKAEDEGRCVGTWLFPLTVVTGFGGGLGMLSCYILAVVGGG